MSRASNEPVVAGEAFGQVEAELKRSLLEANGIQVWLSGESAGAAIGLSVGRMARVVLLVRPEDLGQARALLAGQQPPPHQP